MAASDPLNRNRASLLVGLGLLIAAAGVGVTVYVCAFGGMRYHGLSGWNYWHSLLRGLFLSPAVAPLLFGTALLEGGVGIAVAFLPVACGWSTRSISPRVITALCLGTLLLGLCGAGLALLG